MSIKKVMVNCLGLSKEQIEKMIYIVEFVHYLPIYRFDDSLEIDEANGYIYFRCDEASFFINCFDSEYVEISFNEFIESFGELKKEEIKLSEKEELTNIQIIKQEYEMYVSNANYWMELYNKKQTPERYNCYLEAVKSSYVIESLLKKLNKNER